MKLILTAAVDKLGVPGDIVEVKAGYGRNYLLPRGMAIVATRGAEKQIEGIRRAQEAREIRDLDHAREVMAKLDALENVSVAVKASETGKLFGSVTAGDEARTSSRVRFPRQLTVVSWGNSPTVFPEPRQPGAIARPPLIQRRLKGCGTPPKMDPAPSTRTAGRRKARTPGHTATTPGHTSGPCPNEREGPGCAVVDGPEIRPPS